MSSRTSGARRRARGGWARRACAAALALSAVVGVWTGCATTKKEPAAATAPKVDPAVLAERQVRAGEQAVRDGDTARALTLFQRAIEVNPSLTAAHMGMGDIYRTQGDYAKAEARYGTAAQLEPKNFDAQFYHGLMLHLLERVTDAVQAYLRALDVKPNDFRANLNLATAFYQLDENQQAAVYGERAVRLNPDDGPARFNLGAVYAALGRDREAVQEYQQAAELMELTPDLLLNLGESLGRLNRYEEMVNALEQSLKLEPSPAAFERLGFAKFKLEQYDAALAAFNSALKIDQDYFPALNGRGVSLLNRWLVSDRQDLAARNDGLASLRRSIQVNGRQPQILELLTRYGR